MAVMLAACGEDEILVGKIDFTSPYAITDNASDPIQHHRYEIYRKYGVAVFFNDTISRTQIGVQADGKPIYRYETLDLNWSFTDYDRSNKFLFEYIEDEATQELALLFVDAFLEKASKPMRPFSILLPATFTIRSGSGDDTPDYWSNFRTLVIPNVQNVQADQIATFTNDILISMVKSKIKDNENLVAQFDEVSSKNKYYGKPWVKEGGNGGLGCVWGIPHYGTWWKIEELYDPAAAREYVMYYWSSGVSTMEEFEAERAVIFQQIGKYGFISGNKTMSHLYSPDSAADDLDCYIDTLLEIGSEEFINRYGGSSLVMKKFMLIYDYVKNELELDI